MFGMGEKKLLRRYGLEGMPVKTHAQTVEAVLAAAAMSAAFKHSDYQEFSITKTNLPSLQDVRTKMAQSDALQAFALMADEKVRSSGRDKLNKVKPELICELSVMHNCVCGIWNRNRVSQLDDNNVREKAIKWLAIGESIQRAIAAPADKRNPVGDTGGSWQAEKDALRNMSANELHALVYQMPWAETDFAMQSFILRLPQCDIMTVLLMLWMVEADRFQHYESAAAIPSNKQPCDSHAYRFIDLAFCKIQDGFYKRHGVELAPEERGSINSSLSFSKGPTHWRLPADLLPI